MNFSPARWCKLIANDVGDDGVSTTIEPAFLHEQPPVDQSVRECRCMQPRDTVGVRKHLHATASSRDRDCDQQLVQLLRQPVDTLCDDVMYRLRNREIPALRQSPRGCGPFAGTLVHLQQSLREHRLEQLDGIEGIPTSDPKDPVGKPLRSGGSADVAHLTDHLPQVIFGQWPQCNYARVRFGAEYPAESRSRRGSLQLTHAQCSQPEDRRLLGTPDQESKQIAAVPITPVKIVQPHHQWTLGRKRQHQLGDSLEQSPSFSGVRSRQLRNSWESLP